MRQSVKPGPMGLPIGHPLFDAINLDYLSNDPADMSAASDILMQLALYAELKAKAMTFRLSGAISDALKMERACDGIYQALPEWARW